MNPGPQLHRSLTFWAGILVIIFTCWAWQDSYTHFVLFRWRQALAGSGIGGITLVRHPGAIDPLSLERSVGKPLPDDALYKTFEPPSLVRWKPRGGTPSFTDSHLKQVQRNYVNFAGPGSWNLFLPYWTIVLTLLITWTALLFHRARRQSNISRQLGTIPS